MKTLKTILITLLVLAVLGLGIVYSGVIGVAADEPHAGFTEWLLSTVRERAIHSRTDDIVVPDLDDPALIAAGASHYDAMCAGCHLAPGMDNTELRRGLNPRPPNLAEHGIHDPAETFWVVKHGIRMTGMPAWGVTHDDESLWGIVAFAKRLPEMMPEEYAALTANAGQAHDAGGHEHGDDRGPPESSEATTGHTHGYDGAARSADPVAALDAFHEALAHGDRDTALMLLTRDVRIVEGGHVESRGEYAAGHLAADMAFLSTLTRQVQSRDVSRRDGTVRIVTLTRLTGRRDGKPVDVLSEESAVLELHDGNWRIAHLHWSTVD